MNSLRAKGVMSFQASSAVALPTSAFRKSGGSLCTTPPGTLWPLITPSYEPAGTFYIMNPAQLREHCLSFTGAEETFPFGPETSVFKVRGKIFGLSRLGGDELRVSLKCEPTLAEQLREAHAAVTPGYHLNNRHWNTPAD